jgi:hypothetical protein
MADFNNTFFGSQNSEPAQVPWDSTTLNTQTQKLSYGLKAKQREIDEFYRKLDEGTGGRKSADPITSNLIRQIAHIQNMGGYARPTRFSFIIAGLLAITNERLNRNCMTLSLPGRSVASQPVKIYGPPREFVYEANYQNEFTMVLRVGEDMLEREIFERWMNSSVSLRSSDLSYPDDYMTSMRIYQLDKTDNYVYCLELYNVFCKSMSPIDLGTDLSDQIETVSITLGYSEYQVIGRMAIVVQPIVPTPKVKSQDDILFAGLDRTGKDTDRQMFGNKILDGTQTETEANNRVDSWMKIN